MVYSNLRPAEALLRLSRLGIPYVELSYDNFSTLRKSGIDFTTLVNEVMNIHSSISSKVLIGHLPYGELINKAVVVSEQDKVIRELRRWVEFYSNIGIKVAAIHIPYQLAGPSDTSITFPQKIRDSCILFFKSLVKLGREYSLVLAVENRFERGIFGYLPYDLLDIINSVGDDYLRLCLDVGHAHINGISPKEYYKILHPNVVLIHLHDNDGSKDLHLPPYLGGIDWDGFLSTLKQLGYNGNYVLEVLCNDNIQRCDNIVNLLKILSNYLINSLP